MASQATTESTARPVDRSIEDTDTRLPGLLFVILGVAFITGTMLLASIAPSYDFNGAAISDLSGARQARQ
jgi:hypothetical protein